MSLTSLLTTADDIALLACAILALGAGTSDHLSPLPLIGCWPAISTRSSQCRSMKIRMSDPVKNVAALLQAKQ